MRWDEEWFELPAWEILSNLVDFIDFPLERNKPKVKQTDALTEPLNHNKAGYSATLVACRWAGTDKVTGLFGQEQLAQNAKKR